MRYFILLCLPFLFLGDHQVKPFDYEKEKQEALNFLQENNAIIEEVFQVTKMEKTAVLPVIFPELIRYAIVKDLLETAALEAIYVELGVEGADFSIGHFQMKPSFAEQLEEKIRGNPDLLRLFKRITNYTCLLYTSPSPRDLSTSRMPSSA